MKSIFKKGILVENFELKNITSFKTGGKVRYYFIPDSKETLKKLLKSCNLEIFVLGNATNVLVSDKGFNGIIVNLKGFANYISCKGNKIITGASVNLDTLIKFAIDNSLKGLERLSGIPGTVGGALYMNAGAFGKEIGDMVEYVKVLSFKGREKIFYKEQIDFSYREAIPLNKYIILECGLKLYKSNKKQILKIQKEILKRREMRQPLEYPSAGSIFKRAGNRFAGELIEKAGCKGVKIGDAMVSEKHANFIINIGNASSQDIYKLIKEVQSRVYKRFKIKLQPEIKFLGKFGDGGILY